MVRRILILTTLVTLLSGCASLEEDAMPKAPKFYDPQDYVEYCEGNNQSNMECQMVHREEMERYFRRLIL